MYMHAYVCMFYPDIKQYLVLLYISYHCVQSCEDTAGVQLLYINQKL